MADARRGVVATSDPRASEAGTQVLRGGGNAVDAAVAAALVLFVVEPQSCGLGGDAFLLHHAPGGPVTALDGSGAVPAGLTQERLQADGFEKVPATGGGSATVPGAVGLLEAALERHGSRGLADLMAPAVTLARDGFKVRETLAVAAARVGESLRRDPVLGPLYVPGGTPVERGQRIANPALADAIEAFATHGASALYGGGVGSKVADAVQGDGGYLTIDDLRKHRTEPVEPESVRFRGREVWELPLPTQGPAVLHALGEIEAAGPNADWSHVVEVVEAGLRAVGIDVRAIVTGRPAARGDTTFIAAIDSEGVGASLITSVFGEFGSHLGVEALAGPIHNRAAMFRLTLTPPAPGKPPHTTIPALVTREGELEVVLGVAGGLAQPQAQVQILIRMFEEDLPPQAAIDAPRFKIAFGGHLALEGGHPLADRFPEALERDPGQEGYGAAQVARQRGGTLEGGADARRGGVVAFA